MSWSSLSFVALAALAALAAPACGTYSHMRPADNLEAGRAEVSAGLAFNTLPEVLPVVSAAVGLTDRIELEGQYEVYSALAEVRFGVLTTKANDFALSLGVGGGYASLWVDEFVGHGAALADLALGRRFGEHVEVYLGHKLMWLGGGGYLLNATRAGVRVSWPWGHVGVEGGATVHHSFLVVGEGTGYIGFHM
ncbi:MAG: hypothetical protein U1F43_19360 [Myxococcota bacterium]